MSFCWSLNTNKHILNCWRFRTWRLKTFSHPTKQDPKSQALSPGTQYCTLLKLRPAVSLSLGLSSCSWASSISTSCSMSRTEELMSPVHGTLRVTRQLVRQIRSVLTAPDLKKSQSQSYTSNWIHTNRPRLSSENSFPCQWLLFAHYVS